MQKGKLSEKICPIMRLCSQCENCDGFSDERGHFMEYLRLLWEKATSKRESADSAGAREVMKAFQILVSPGQGESRYDIDRFFCTGDCQP